MSKESFVSSWYKGLFRDIQWSVSVWHAQFTSSENFMGPPGERRQWQMGSRALWLWEAIKIEKIRIEWEFPFRSFIPPCLNGNNDWFWKGSLSFNFNFSILTASLALSWSHSTISLARWGDLHISGSRRPTIWDRNTEEFWSYNSPDLIVNWRGTKKLSY